MKGPNRDIGGKSLRTYHSGEILSEVGEVVTPEEQQGNEKKVSMPTRTDQRSGGMRNASGGLEERETRPAGSTKGAGAQEKVEGADGA